VHRVLLEGAEATLELDQAPDWIVGNHEGNGFYRVELADADLQTVAARAGAVLSPLERYGLVEDEFALLLAGRSSVARLFGLVRSLADDDDLSVWQRTIGVTAGIGRVAPDDQVDAYRGWLRALLAPALQRLGDRKVDGEPERTTALRASLFDALARFGDDQARRDQAAAHFAALGTDPDAVDADLADAVVRVVASTADQGTWDELRRRATTARTAQDRLRHQGALADARDPALVLRFCELCFTDEVRSQDALFLLARALRNRYAAADVWSLLTERWEEITTRFPSSTVPRMIDGIRGVSDRELAASIAAFLADHPVKQGTKPVQQHLERMWVTVALADRIRDELGTALS
jgi:puromycin-sensitive aminopeptidase